MKLWVMTHIKEHFDSLKFGINLPYNLEIEEESIEI